MDAIIRVFLILGSVVTFVFVMRCIRRSRVRIEDTFFWLLLAAALLVLSVFPDIAVRVSGWLRVESPVNLVYLAVIFILIVKQFFTSLKLSQLTMQVRALAQRLAMNEKDGTKP